MFIDCPGCARSYHIKAADIGSGGRKVICPRCRTDWFVHTAAAVPARTFGDVRAVAISARTAPLTIDAAPLARQKRRSALRRLSVPAAVAAGVALSMGLLGAREKIALHMPRTASLYEAIGLPINVRGLEIVADARRDADAAATVSGNVRVAGTIRNVTPHRVPMPRLVYEARDARGAPLATWTETPPAPSLATGRSLAFVSSPHLVPPQSSSVIVRFETGDDTAATPRRHVSALD